MQPDKILRSRRKTLAIEVRPDGQVWVRAPLRLAQRTIDRFLAEKSGWIQKKLAQIQKQRDDAQAGPADQPRQAYYLGQAYPLAESAGVRKPILAGSTLLIPAGLDGRVDATLAKFYASEAKKTLTPLIRERANALHLDYTKLRISSARTRWGSCSHRGTISLSWRLMMLPTPLIEYVILHELVHLKVHNHSPRFWQTLTAILPETPERRRLLRVWEKKLYFGSPEV